MRSTTTTKNSSVSVLRKTHFCRFSVFLSEVRESNRIHSFLKTHERTERTFSEPPWPSFLKKRERDTRSAPLFCFLSSEFHVFSFCFVFVQEKENQKEKEKRVLFPSLFHCMQCVERENAGITGGEVFRCLWRGEEREYDETESLEEKEERCLFSFEKGRGS